MMIRSRVGAQMTLPVLPALFDSALSNSKGDIG